MIVAFTGAGISKESGIDTFQDRPYMRKKFTREFANANPEEYREAMREFVNMVRDRMPNDAHYALAEYNIPIITLNLDDLHQKAGSKNILTLHGRLPNEGEMDYCNELREAPVLYGDLAPSYGKAYEMVAGLNPGDTLLIVGVSDDVNISALLRGLAYNKGIAVVDINDNASIKVRKFLEEESKRLD